MSRLFAIFGTAVLTACASVPRATPDKDQAAKEFRAPPAGKASLYVFRDETYGGNFALALLLDGRALADTTQHTFITTDVDPGKHTLVSKGENMDSLDFSATAGEQIFVWQEVKMGIWSPKTLLHKVEAARGKQGVSKCELVKGY